MHHHSCEFMLISTMLAGLGHAVRWKQQLQRNVKSVFSKKRKDLEDLVYGDHEEEVCYFCSDHSHLWVLYGGISSRDSWYEKQYATHDLCLATVWELHPCLWLVMSTLRYWARSDRYAQAFLTCVTPLLKYLVMLEMSSECRYTAYIYK